MVHKTPRTAMVQEFASIWLFLLLFVFLFDSRYSTSFIPLNGIWRWPKNAPSPTTTTNSSRTFSQKCFWQGEGGGEGIKKGRKGRHVLEMSPLIEALFSTIQEKGGRKYFPLQQQRGSNQLNAFGSQKLNY